MIKIWRFKRARKLTQLATEMIDRNKSISLHSLVEINSSYIDMGLDIESETEVAYVARVFHVSGNYEQPDKTREYADCSKITIYIGSIIRLSKIEKVRPEDMLARIITFIIRQIKDRQDPSWDKFVEMRKTAEMVLFNVS